MKEFIKGCGSNMRKLFTFNLLLAFIVIILLSSQITGCDKRDDTIYLDGKIKEINIKLTNKTDQPNPIFISFTDDDSIKMLKKIITSADRLDGKVDIREQDGNMIIIYEDDGSEYFYLWLGERGSKGGLMKVEEMGTSELLLVKGFKGVMLNVCF